MSGTNKLIQSENAMENESIENLNADLMDANNEALSEQGITHEKEE